MSGTTNPGRDNPGGSRARKARDSEPKPWEKRPGETSAAYAAFVVYRDLGPLRSLEKAHRKCPEGTPKIDALKRLSAKHQWLNRCEKWDAHIQRKKDVAAASYAGRWEVRRLEAIEETWKLADSLADRIDKMLAMPLTTQELSEDGKVIHVHPARWSYQSIAVIAKTLAELRVACIAAAIRPPGEYAKGELLAMLDGRAGFMVGEMPPDDAAADPVG